MAAPFPICYLNSEFVALHEARISPLDRGFLFADSVYEVLPAFDGRMFRLREHLDRLERGLAEVRIATPFTHEQWLDILHELIRRNGSADMYVYIQVTRGAEYGRNHTFPEGAQPTVFAMAAPLPVLTAEDRAQGWSAITVEDFRWGRCDIKSTMLLANVLMKQRAADAGAQEAIIVSNGEVLEGSSTSVFLVLNGTLVTPPNSHRLLPGTTRDVALELANAARLPIEIRRISLDELWRAQEVWISSSTRDVVPITRIDDQPIGDARPGPHWLALTEAFQDLRHRLAATSAFEPAP